MLKLLTFIFSIIFATNVFAANGAGGLLLFDDGTVLIAKEPRRTNAGVRFEAISDFGGGQDPNETYIQTAVREIKEETGHYSFPQITSGLIAKSPYADHHHVKSGNFYREFLIRIHGKKPSIAEIMNNAKRAEKTLGKKRASIEKTEWMYVPAQDLLNAANTNNPLLPGIKTKLYDPFMGVLKKPQTQKALQDLINNVKNVPAQGAPKPPVMPVPASPLQHRLEKINSLSELLHPTKIVQLGPDTIICVDLDETLILDEYYLKGGIDRKHLQGKPYVALEANIAQIMRQLKNANGHQITILGLTKRGYNDKKGQHHLGHVQIEKLGIPLSRQIYKNHNGASLSKTYSNIKFDGGVIYTANKDKGYYLGKFLDLVKRKPKHLIMIDDLRNNLNDVYTMAKARGIILHSYQMEAANNLGTSAKAVTPLKISNTTPKNTPVAAKHAPTRVIAKRAQTKVAAKPVPTKAVAKPVPAKIVAKRAPIKIVAKRVVRVVAKRVVRVVAKRAPAKVAAKPAPAKIVAKRAPIKIVAKRAPARVVAKRAPARVAAKRAPIRKATAQKVMFKRRARR